MEPKLLLVKAITLLYKEALIKDASDRSLPLVEAVLETIKIPETGAEFGGVRERLIELKRTARWMAQSHDNTPFDKAGLLQRIRVAAGEDDSIFYAFEIGMEDNDVPPDEILKQCLSIRGELNDHLNERKFQDLASLMYRKAAFGQGPEVGTREFIREMAKELGELSKHGSEKRIKGMVDEITFNNVDDAARVLTRAKDALSMEGALRFGQSALNDACYDHPGGLRGEYWLVSALPHNYKSGLGLVTFMDIALYNKPWMLDKTKKPLIIHISTENDVDQNALMTYQMLKERETGEVVFTKGMDPREAAEYVKGRLGVNGYHTYMCRVDPSDTSVFDIQELVEQKEAEGYEIHAVVLDYAAMLDKAGLAQGTTGADLRDMHRRLRNFFTKRKTFCLTFHQLSPDAMRLQRMGVEDIVKEVAGRGYYDGCTKLLQEVDVDITIHIETIGETHYLSMQWAKHRKAKATPRHLWYAAMKMSSVGGLLPDVDRPAGTPPNYVRDLKSLRQADGGGDWYTQAIAA